MMFATAATALPHIKSGKLRALGVASQKRSPLLPDLPTIAEQGVARFEAVSWYALMVPAGTPRRRRRQARAPRRRASSRCPTRAPSSPRKAWTRAAARRRNSRATIRARDRALERGRAQAEHQARMSELRTWCSSAARSRSTTSQRLHAGGTARRGRRCDARERIRASAAVVQRAAAGDAPVYGVNTGFGKLAGNAHRRRRSRAAAAEPDPLAQRRRRRSRSPRRSCA